MKKKNFLSGLGAKLALAVVALTTVTFTSCEEEDFSIEVKINPAKVTLNTEVLYFNENGTPTNVTDKATITYDGASNNVFQGTQEQPAINKTVKVVASYKGQTAEKDVKIEAGANTTMTQNVTIFIIAPEANIALTEKVTDKTEKTIWSNPLNGHGYSHDGKVWNENPNAFFVTISGTYTVFNSQKIVGYELKEGAEEVSAKELIEKIANSKEMAWDKNMQDTYSYEASAYSIFAAFITKTTYAVDYLISNTTSNKEIAVIKASRVESSKIDWEEKEHPNHAGHYHEGHGHGHGDASNAGGGIIFAD